MSEISNTEIIELDILGLESQIKSNILCNPLDKYWEICFNFPFINDLKNLVSVLD